MTRVYFNGRFLARPITGVERFAGEIIRAVDALCAQESATVAGMEFEIVCPPGDGAGGSFGSIADRVVGARSGHLWEQLELPRYVRDGILVNLCNTAPLVRTVNVTCVHDANVFLIPENYRWSFRVAYQNMLPLIIRRSSRWITVSAYSATQLERLGVADRPPSAIIGNGIEHICRLERDRSRFSKVRLPRPFVLALGSISRNKNISLLLGLADALEELGISLLLLGGVNRQVFGEFPVRHRRNVLDLGRVEDEDIAYLYSQALCFAFPSLYEGFGIPAIEAMASGCPVIAANSSALPEVLGDAALLCSPTEPQAWRSAISSLAVDLDLRARLVKRGLERAASYSWHHGALQLLDVVRSLADCSDHARRGSNSVNFMIPSRLVG
jgi:glycosyltransferase involved in cell wall biosynthesis